MICTYVYPGFHPIPERDESFHPGFTEWELVRECRPRFDGHAQPHVPLLGEYDDRDPAAIGARVRLAAAHGVDAWVYGFFWCRGKRVFQEALDEGFLGSPEGRAFPFALMWANRMPRRVLPVRRADLPVIDPARLVSSDVDDFVALMTYVAERYMGRDNYVRVGGRPYFSIFDSTFFVRELGRDGATAALAAARRAVGDVHFAAIDPAAEVVGDLRAIGFDSVTHYVLLPHWKGEYLQDYATVAAERAASWSEYARASGLPYCPSVSPGWDASPRAADFGEAAERPRKYPWWPIVVGEHPDKFQAAVARALAYPSEMTFVASWNEWSEGHFLEPDTRFGHGWLEALKNAKG
jgi:hypothetical protein